jgi:hypothetical protein
MALGVKGRFAGENFFAGFFSLILVVLLLQSLILTGRVAKDGFSSFAGGAAAVRNRVFGRAD